MQSNNDAPKPAVRKALAAEAKVSPTKVFDTPNNVVSAAHLTKKEKVEILEQWESDAISLQTATDEGMSGGKQPRLDEVKSAQTMLGADSATISAVASTVTLINTFNVAPEAADRLVVELIVAIETAMHPLAGFISASVHKSMDSKRIVNYAQWANRTDYERMMLNPVAIDHMARCVAIAKSVEPVIYDVVFSQ